MKMILIRGTHVVITASSRTRTDYKWTNQHGRSYVVLRASLSYRGHTNDSPLWSNLTHTHTHTPRFHSDVQHLHPNSSSSHEPSSVQLMAMLNWIYKLVNTRTQILNIQYAFPVLPDINYYYYYYRVVHYYVFTVLNYNFT